METQTKYSVARQLPSDILAEQCLLGAILIDNDVLFDLTTRPDEFLDARNVAIFNAMTMLARDNHPIDTTTLSSALGADKKLESSGGAEYICELLNATPSSIGANRYAETIRRAYVQRQIIRTAGEIAGIAYDARQMTDQDLLSAVHQKMMNLEMPNVQLDGVSLDDAIIEFLPDLDQYLDAQGRDWGIPTGLIDLDAYIGGLARGEMTLIAADPGKGKTMLAMTIAVNAAKRGHRGVFFSLEMTRRQLMLRLFAERGNVNTADIRRGKINPLQRRAMMDNIEIINKIPLVIYDDPMDTAMIERALLRQQRRGQVDFAIVDYSDLLKDRAESEVVRMKVISHALKNIAKRTGVALVVVHPINRESDESKPPELRNLGWGRAWEYDSHTVLFPFFEKDRKDFSALIKVGKYRDGIANQKINLIFDGKRWADASR